MKHIFFCMVALLILSASDCKKENKNCHKTIYIKNNSNMTISIAEEYKESSKCKLSRITDIEPNKSFNDVRRSCWEELLKGYKYEFYVIDPAKFNPGLFYGCDSVEQYNTVLKHYSLSVDDLRANNFIITYP